MNSNTPNPIEQRQHQLRQAMLELHFDLLEESEAAKLRHEIATDPQVAAEWASILELATKLRAAAKLALPPRPMRGFEVQKTATPVATTPVKYPVWVAPSIIAAIAACVGFVLISWQQLSDVPRAPAATVRIEARIVPGNRGDRQNEFRFVTSRLDGASLASGQFPLTPAILSFSVLAKSQVLFRGTAETGPSGTAKIVLPRELVVPDHASLEVTARSPNPNASDSIESSSVSVPLEPTRCLTYVTVDRPVYRPGETIYFRSLTLERRFLRPLVEVPIRYEVLGPNGSIVSGMFIEGVTDRGVGNGVFTIPTTAPGGSYTLVAKSLDGFFPEERRDFEVREYRVPRFKTKIEFRHRSYGAGDTVEADFSAERAEGGPATGTTVSISAKVDDTIVHQQTSTMTDSGTLSIAFHLPMHISQGVGHLSCVVDDGGTRESTVKTIPIQLGQVAIEFYPEGGYLVAGLSNRVYFVARDSLGKPIQLSGEVQSRSGSFIADATTTRDGMGRFEFTPVFGERYTLKVSSPVDVTDAPSLPAVVKDLPVIDTGTGVFGVDAAIAVTVRSATRQKVVLRAVCRGKLVGESPALLDVGDNPISLDVADDCGGVIRLTVLDGTTVPAKPLVERLVYRHLPSRLTVEIVDAGSALNRTPGEPTRMTLQVRDETGEPAPAVLGIAVVDEAALSLDKSDKPTMATHFLLTSEIKKPEDLEHANFYLGDDDAAAESLDLLLATQGWRRFVSGSSTQPSVDFREQLVRLLQLDGNAADAESRTIENASTRAYQWAQYRDAIASAWRIVLLQTRVFLAIVLTTWVISLAVRLRRLRKLAAVAGVVTISTALLLSGCGGHASNRVLSSAEVAEYEDAMGKQAPGALSARPTTAVRPTNEAMAEQLDLMLRGLSPQSETLAELRRAGFGQPVSDDPLATQTISQDQLKQLLASRGIDAQTLADQLLDELRFPVRQYAHVHAKGGAELREDFAETLYWQPLLITDSDGRASIRFDLSDSITTFQVAVDAHSAGGRIGSFTGKITTRMPLQIEPQLPLEVTAGDRIEMPMAVINSSAVNIDVDLSVTADDALAIHDDAVRKLTIDAGSRTREFVTLDVISSPANPQASITIRGASAAMSDSVRRTLRIAPSGYPASESVSGRLLAREGNRATARLKLPQAMVPGSLQVNLRAFPSPLADMMSGIESILREPHGCFEQASATNYPNAMALLYLRERESPNPEVAERAMAMLNRGYAKLISYECSNHGYEWFGSDPGHEALSAFGLMQFMDMSKVMAVDQAMVARTRVWLLGRRDGQGGFQRNSRNLHAWSVKQEIVNAYVLWALTEADVAAGQPLLAANELQVELQRLETVAAASRDPYLIALSAATLMNVRRTHEGERLLEQLVQLQDADGSLRGQTTVVSSGGLSLAMETTALAVIAWSKNSNYIPNVQGAVNWINSHRVGSGGFGSTQATVLALKALLAATGKSSTSTRQGRLQVRLAGELIAEAKFAASEAGAVEVVGLDEKIFAHSSDSQNIELELIAIDADNVSYTIESSYNTRTPARSDACPLELATRFSDDVVDNSVAVGSTLQVIAELRNKSDQGQPMTVAIVGLPGGVEPRIEKLDELRAAGEFDYYELRGREVILYWRTIQPQFERSIAIDVTATVPGKYTGPASRTYLYYTAEEKYWTEPLVIEIRR